MIARALAADADLDIGGMGLGEGELQQVCGALSIIVCVIWSVWEKKRNAQV